eukprot:6166192-Pleurochrysis_carterae.AAC.1
MAAWIRSRSIAAFAILAINTLSAVTGCLIKLWGYLAREPMTVNISIRHGDKNYFILLMGASLEIGGTFNVVMEASLIHLFNHALWIWRMAKRASD